MPQTGLLIREEDELRKRVSRWQIFAFFAGISAFIVGLVVGLMVGQPPVPCTFHATAAAVIAPTIPPPPLPEPYAISLEETADDTIATIEPDIAPDTIGTNLLLAKTVQTDELQAHGYDVLLIQQGILNLLAKSDPQAVRKIVELSRLHTGYRVGDPATVHLTGK